MNERTNEWMDGWVDEWITTNWFENVWTIDALQALIDPNWLNGWTEQSNNGEKQRNDKKVNEHDQWM